METSEFLALHHQRLVDAFIESVLAEMDLTDLERNVVGVVLRREVETGLVPGLVAVQAVFQAADVATLGEGLPEWLDRVSAVMPVESEFLAEMGRRLDPDGAAVFYENAGLMPSESEAVREFRTCLWEMAPAVNRSG